jgi:uncharacterized protein YoxC
MATKNKEGSMVKKVLVGAGIVAGAALAAYLMTPLKERKKAEAKIKKWMRDMQKEVAGRAKAIKGLSRDKYEEIVDEVAPKYEALRDVSATEIESFTKELKAHWSNISKAVVKSGKKKKK